MKSVRLGVRHARKDIMKLSASYQGGTRYDIVSGTHRIVTDQPVADGGQDAGLSPVELFVGSIASCVGYFVGRFCARHDVPQDGLTVEAEWTMAENPHRVGAIGVDIHLPHRITPELKDRLLKVAHGCTVHQSIVVASNISITLNSRRHHEVPK
jgi:uncharacterized OsmC-like protein